MAEELEIKLTMTPETLRRAEEWLLRQEGVSGEGAKTLGNRYYDTPEAGLHRQKIALRVRQADDSFIQTLKTRGEYVDGAHRRQEWEWPLAEGRLDTGLIADTPVGQGVDLARLAPVFETNFQRRILMVERHEATVECALDEGWVLAGSQRKELCELEFELKRGAPEILLELTAALAAEVPVMINLISKAEQGYSLAGWHQPAAPGESESVVNRVLHGLSRAWLQGHADAELEQALEEVAGRVPENSDTARRLSWLRDGLSAGRTVARLAEDRQLGLCQLGLLAGR